MQFGWYVPCTYKPAGAEKQTCENAEKMRTIEKLNDAFRGRTAYILGSGPSLSVEAVNSAHEAGGLVFAVNASILASPNCDFWLSDDQDAAGWTYFWRELVESNCRVLLYYDKFATHFTEEGMEKLFGKRLYWFRHRKKYSLTKPYADTPYLRLCESRNSLGTAIHVAYIMGCERAVLLGVDGRYIDGKKYFFESWPRDKQPVRVSPRLKRIIHSKVNGQTSDTDLVETDDYWKILADNIPAGFEVFNATPGSFVKVFPEWHTSVAR